MSTRRASERRRRARLVLDQKAEPELGWRMEVKADDGGWAFFDDSEGDRKY